MTEPIKKNNDRETWGDLEFRWPAGTHHVWPRELEPGDLIAFEHQVWRVIDVAVLEDKQVRTIIRPAADDPTWTATDADKHLRWSPYARVPRYPQADHLPVCGDCGGPWPCRELHVRREMARDLDRATRYELAGVCPACGEPVTTRQTRQTWRVNLYAFDRDQPVTFHLRRQCVQEAMDYDRSCMAQGQPSQMGQVDQ